VASINKFLRDTIKQIDDMEKKKRQLKLLITPRKMTAKLGVFSKHVSPVIRTSLPAYSRSALSDLSRRPASPR
jgi:hypothetical protein